MVVTNLRQGNTRTPNYQGVPTVVFTTPPLARVGLTEAAAFAQGLKFTTHHEDTTDWYSSRRPHAAEIINIFGLAIRHELRASDLSNMVYAYPTSASDISSML